MIKEPKSMEEIHKIRKSLYGIWSKMNDGEVINTINKTADEFLKDHNINLKTISKSYDNSAKTVSK